jgi:hypothetical protein
LNSPEQQIAISEKQSGGIGYFVCRKIWLERLTAVGVCFPNQSLNLGAQENGPANLVGIDLDAVPAHLKVAAKLDLANGCPLGD